MRWVHFGTALQEDVVPGEGPQWTRDILRGSPLAEDAELIVSELSANAILHTASGQESGSFHLALAVSPQVIALSVTDDGGADTAPNRTPSGASGARGLTRGRCPRLAHVKDQSWCEGAAWFWSMSLSWPAAQDARSDRLSCEVVPGSAV
nr:ATP-binding protein [Streptomyces sp.]